ncbi:helix-turn-helix transcriptional regulator [Streptomyces sp. VRA16 Mangrove soil]|uniref:helix-turn-helix domain-containing protein n=1 Tax=Streptomyces sp. VRA16 Mangrove soil TaxID=2817434 RepID=UPI001A9EB4A8|nr:helix-turn-helix transcriptional regulator [Streptomyces sp. VRA16 Mangrove soil]MBO1333456.1 helix-turn-helix transcriptional regulator [Streptomyces sp. VRA16 Mangrove soil]
MTARAVLLLTAAAYEADPQGPGVDAGLVLRAAAAAGLDTRALDDAGRAGLTRSADGRLRLPDPRARYTAEPPARRRAAHRCLSDAATGERQRVAGLLHRALATPCPDERLGTELAAAARQPGPPTGERATAAALAAGLTADPAVRAERLVTAAELFRRAGRFARARELLDGVGELAPPSAVRGYAALVHGLLALRDGPVADARESLLLAAALCAPGPALDARLAAAEAAWALGDAQGYREVVGVRGAPPGPGAVLDYRLGMSASLGERFRAGRAALTRVVERAASRAEDEPAALLRAGAAALVAGNIEAACRIGAGALAAARARDAGTDVPRALELLAYGELRAGRHARARAHAEEGLRTARATGQRNLVAGQHAVLALVASLDSDAGTVAHHADAAQHIAARHGLVQTETLAQWALARADLARGRAAEAVARLGPLVAPGPRRGHFAVRMLAVPCFVEAAALAGEPGGARAAVAEFTVWAERGYDPQAPAQLARCRALFDPSDELFGAALDRHDRAGGDFERARTAALYGKWLRRTRRPARARALLRDALIAFERCGAAVWAAQTAAELRATGEAPAGTQPAGELGELTPQQLRIARWVAEGDTNREVARRLSVSPRTVDHHLRNVFARLGVRSRVELARLVHRAERPAATL